MYIFSTLWWYLWRKMHIAIFGSWYILGRGIQNYALINTSCISWNEIVRNCRYMMLLQLGWIMCYKNCCKNYRHVNCQVLLCADSRTVRCCYVQTVELQDHASICKIWVLKLQYHFSMQTGNFKKWWELFSGQLESLWLCFVNLCVLAHQTCEHRQLYCISLHSSGVNSTCIVT